MLGRLASKGKTAKAVFGSVNGGRSISSSSNLILKQSPSLAKQALLPNSLRPLSHPGLARTMFSGSASDIARRYRRQTGVNLGIKFVPQQSAYVIERFGKFTKTLDPGFHLLVPIVDKIAYIHSLKEQTIEIPEQPAVTTDNVSIRVNGVLFATVLDPVKASYGNDNPMVAVTQLAQTVMRSCIGKMPLDKTFMERETLNANIVEAINRVAIQWGLTCRRYEISPHLFCLAYRDIIPPKGIRESMEMQAEAERKKRAEIIEAEGHRQAIILKAEAEKTDVILRSEAAKMNDINRAEGEAEAILIKTKAAAESIYLIAEALQKDGGQDAASLKVALAYVQAFGNLAKKSTTVLLPSSIDNPASMVTQALTLYKKMVPEEATAAAVSKA